EDLWLLAKLFEVVSFAEEVKRSPPDGVAHKLRRLQRADEQQQDICQQLGLQEVPSLFALKMDFDRWVSAINRFTPSFFMQYACLYREDEGTERSVLQRFLESLSLELEWERVKQRLDSLGLTKQLPPDQGCIRGDPPHHWTPWTRIELGRGGFDVIGHEAKDPQDVEAERFINKVSSKKFPQSTGTFRYWFWHSWSSFWRIMSQGSATNSFTANYSISPAVQLLGCSDVELAMMLKEMTLLSPHSRAFTTVLGRAIVSQAANKVNCSFQAEILVDVGFIFVLCWIARDVSIDKVPSIILVLCLGILAVTTIGSLFARIITSLCFFRSRHFAQFSDHMVVLWKTVAFWTLLQIFLELFSVFVVLWYVWCIQKNDWARAKQEAGAAGDVHFPKVLWFFFADKLEMFHRREEVEKSVLSDHPSYLSFLILLRWIHFIVALFQYESVGRNIVPVIHAVRQPESLFYMIFLLLALMASCHAYAVYPIEENVGSWNESFNAVLKIFRLEFLGDFDLNEMEGLDDEIHGTIKNNTISAEMDEQKYNSKYHQGIRTQFVFLSLGITLVAMNTYIGLLGELYSQAVKRKNQLYSHYLAATTYQHLCLTIFLSRLCCGASRHHLQEDSGMYWISYNKAILVDAE
ncbi:Uncharacterized protein SCF082_LOCUS26161, partial [Durusdinium trenchii]